MAVQSANRSTSAIRGGSPHLFSRSWLGPNSTFCVRRAMPMHQRPTGKGRAEARKEANVTKTVIHLIDGEYMDEFLYSNQITTR